jgi:DNA (cytosine-5)-methyltransferase 1
MLRFGSLFSGIGGMDLGLERAGMECVWQVEINSYRRRILHRHWPGVPKFNDVREVKQYDLRRADLIAGGFPCQDISLAGLHAGLSGERSGLWLEMFRIVRELRPKYVLVENVSALLNRGAGRVLADLASIGFDAEWETLRASDFGASHRRERVFIVAYANEGNGQARVGTVANGTRKIFRKGNQECVPLWLQTPDQFIGMDDGISQGLYEQRGGGIGDAVAPPIAQWIGERILEAEALNELSLGKTNVEKLDVLGSESNLT